MCKHILNAQVSIRAPCCQKFYDCPQCHAETQSHPLRKTTEMAFICKKCKKAFRKDLSVYEESDEFCPHCDNHYVIEAKTPAPIIGIEGEDARVDNRMLRDDRVKYDPRKDFYSRRLEAQEVERIDEGGWRKALMDRSEGRLGTDGLPLGELPRDKDGNPLFPSASSALGGGGGGVEFNDDDLDWN
ncbi:hypothetical protein IE53DRAFT_404563 [Violaceomyces palustris]|uniref:Uncharacterized protein n=1 Tax=Violaceomyces palustris TaxID=1673888 RepID=A0ACD0P646_9BASI|nr:hypothetical protein IE53DRAFT_404563 [Violaceomyces palustris]